MHPPAYRPGCMGHPLYMEMKALCLAIGCVLCPGPMSILEFEQVIAKKKMSSMLKSKYSGTSENRPPPITDTSTMWTKGRGPKSFPILYCT